MHKIHQVSAMKLYFLLAEKFFYIFCLGDFNTESDLVHLWYQ
jgi:hypothetical protein